MSTLWQILFTGVPVPTVISLCIFAVHRKTMEQFNQKLLEVMLGNGFVSELAYRFPLLLSWLTWVAASIVCLLVALVACLKWFLLSEWEIKETFSTMVFQGYLYYLITPTSNSLTANTEGSCLMLLLGPGKKNALAKNRISKILILCTQ